MKQYNYSERNEELEKNIDITFNKVLQPYIISNIEKYLKSVNKEISILDIGCGCGYLTNQIKEKTKQDVTGIDSSKDAILFAQNKYPNIKFINMQLEKYCSIKKYDVCILNMVLHNVKDIKSFINKLKELLNDTGILIINMTHPYFWIQEKEFNNINFNYNSEECYNLPFKIKNGKTHNINFKYYHRTLEKYIKLLLQNNLTIIDFKEDYFKEIKKYKILSLICIKKDWNEEAKDKENYIEVNRKAYNMLCNQYEYRLNNKSKYDDIFGEIANLSSKFMNQNNKITVLEIGPGSGELLKIFEDKGYNTFAVELSENMCQLASKTSPNTTFINDNILKVKFLKQQFDIIHAGAVIHNFPLEDAQLLLKNINNWLKEDGVLTLTTTLETSLEEGYFSKKDYRGNIIRYRKKWTKEKLEKVLNLVGFNIIEKICIKENDRKKDWIILVCKKAN